MKKIISNTMYVLSLSFGKDSMALLLEVIKRKLPLDYVIYCDVMFDPETSGENPVMAEWIPKAEKILKEKFGIEVIHISAPKSFKEQFYSVKKRGNHTGEIYGYPYIIGSWCNQHLKLRPIDKFVRKVMKSCNQLVQYIGIAQDEPVRIAKLKNKETEDMKYITLADFDIKEEDAIAICKEHDLLSPKYDTSFRGGCWFCPKQSMHDLYCLWKNYPHYYQQLQDMEKDSRVPFRNDTNLTYLKECFESGWIPKKIIRRKTK